MLYRRLLKNVLMRGSKDLKPGTISRILKDLGISKGDFEGIEEGDLVEIEVVDERVVLMPKKLVDKSQAYFWTKRWQEGEREAGEDIKDGRVKTFDSVDEPIKDLDKE